MAAKWWRYNSTSHIFEQSLDEGTSWTKPPLNASIITEGVFDIARLPPYPTVPPNIAYTNVSNLFTVAQTIGIADGLYLSAGGFVRQHLRNTTAGAGLQTFVIINYQNELSLAPGSDDGSLPAAGYSTWRTGLTITRSGEIVTAGTIYPGRVDIAFPAPQQSWYLGSHGSYGLYTNTGLYTTGAIWTASHIYIGGSILERGRGIALGQWYDFTPTLYNSGSALITTVGIYSSRYMVVGKTMFLSMLFEINPAASSMWFMYLPAGYTTAGYSSRPIFASVITGTPVIIAMNTSPNTYIPFYGNMLGGGTMPSGTVRVAVEAAIQIN